MLQRSVSSKKQWQYLLIIPMLLGTLHSFAFEDSIPEDAVSLSDTIPIPNLKKIMVTDTIITFDPNTYEEEMRIVTSEQQFVEVKDTIVTFDPSTFEEQIRIVKRDVPLGEYLKEIGIKIPELKNIDDTFPCYAFSWGGRIFVGRKNIIFIEEFKELTKKDLNIIRIKDNCEEISVFRAELSIMTSNQNIQFQFFDWKDKTSKIGKDWTDAQLEGAFIFINNINVNGLLIDPIRLKVR